MSALRYAYIPATGFAPLTRDAKRADAGMISTPPHFLRHFVNRCFTDAAQVAASGAFAMECYEPP